MSGADRTVATDDLLCQRVTRCSVCGRQSGHLELAFVEVNGLVFLTGRCERCRRNDPDMQQLLAMLERRYERKEQS
jgi:hypothetical protein